MQKSGSLKEIHLHRVSEAVSKITRLSSVPCDCWCELAAEACNQILPDSIVRVTVADFSNSGSIESHFCQETFVPEPIRQRFDGVESASRGKHGSLNWWIRSASPVVATLGGLSTNEKWLASAAGKHWAGYDAYTMLVGLGRIGSDNAGRAIAIELAVPKGIDVPQNSDESVFRAVLPFLVARASAAFGAEHTVMVTAREVEVLIMLANGLSVKEIAAKLDRSEHTVHDHVKSLHKKLRANSRGELIARALGYDENNYRPEGKPLVGSSGHGSSENDHHHSDVVVVFPAKSTSACA